MKAPVPQLGGLFDSIAPKAYTTAHRVTYPWPETWPETELRHIIMYCIAGVKIMSRTHTSSSVPAASRIVYSLATLADSCPSCNMQITEQSPQMRCSGASGVVHLRAQSVFPVGGKFGIIPVYQSIGSAGKSLRMSSITKHAVQN